MLEFSAKKRLKKILYSWPIIAILFLIAAVLGRADFGLLGKERQSRESLETARRELASLLERKNQLQSKIGKMESERGVEEIIRDEWGAGRPGEKMIVIVEEKEDEQKGETEEKGWWKRFIKILRY